MVAAALFFIAYVFLAIVFLAGITLLIFGLVFKKKKLWIPGVIISAISLIIGIVVLIVYLININKSSYNSYDSDYYSDYDQATDIYEVAVPTDTGYYLSKKTDSILSSNFGVPVTAFLMDPSENPYKVNMYPDKFMAQRGIKLLSFNLTVIDEMQNGMEIEIMFQKNFKGKFMLEIYGEDDVEISNNVLKANQEAGKTAKLLINLNKVINVEKIRYCTLTAFE